MARRIRKANISFISLVPSGANKIEAVYKDDGSVTFGSLLKTSDTFDEQGLLTAVVYAPELRDSQGDIADAAVVKQMAHDFIANGAKIDIRHDGKAVPAEKARIAESFIVEKTDTRFHNWTDRDGKPVNLEGAWATIIKIEDPELRKMYRSGEWAGVSMGGTAVVEQEKSLEKMLEEILTKITGTPNTPTNDTTMDEAKILKAITDGQTALAATLVTAIKEALKPEPPKTEVPANKEEDAPKFTGDPENPRALQVHSRKLQLYQLRKGTNMNDATEVSELQEAIAVLKEQWKEEDDAAGIEPEGVRKPLRKAGPAVNGQNAPLQLVGGMQVSKEDLDAIEAGKQVALARNKARAAK